MSDFVIVSFRLTVNISCNEQKTKLVVPQEMCLKGQQYFLAGAVQMGMSGSHFLAIVNHYHAYAVLDDLDDTEVLYPTLAAVVSRLLYGVNMWKSYSHMKYVFFISFYIPRPQCLMPVFPHACVTGYLL